MLRQDGGQVLMSVLTFATALYPCTLECLKVCVCVVGLMLRQDGGQVLMSVLTFATALYLSTLACTDFLFIFRVCMVGLLLRQDGGQVTHIRPHFCNSSLPQYLSMYRLSVCFQSVCGGVAPKTRWRTSIRVRPRCCSSSMPSSSSSLRSGSLSTWRSTATSWSAGTRSGPHRACPRTWRWPPFWFSSEYSQSHPLGLLVWLFGYGLFLICWLDRRAYVRCNTQKT